MSPEEQLQNITATIHAGKIKGENNQMAAQVIKYLKQGIASDDGYWWNWCFSSFYGAAHLKTPTVAPRPGILSNL
ncbi:14105_t:CDS:2 [Entrophospora sp. SA101]|nr:21477_t:CDS:2 [Entrophospora sp. SA101]CAJ0871002.1 7803_t:CDS:2 [Entrophospora sp. SA101]CAJ0916761.1 5935_t:CDS:2 [Entrophospora sp. SA101]CAJ0917371.1 14105_t:CDS:2 [Entrophospora sp. SA101]